MANSYVVLTCHILAVVACGYELMEVINVGKSTGGIKGKMGNWYYVYGCAFPGLGLTSNLLGTIGMVLDMIGNLGDGDWYYQHHYFTAWLTSCVGYPAYVTLLWLAHHGLIYDQLFHGALILFLLLMWLNSDISQGIQFPTQFDVGVSILSHFYLTLLAYQLEGYNGMAGCAIMICNLLFLTTTTTRQFAGMKSREGYILGVALAAFVFSLELQQTNSSPNSVTITVPLM